MSRRQDGNFIGAGGQQYYAPFIRKGLLSQLSPEKRVPTKTVKPTKLPALPHERRLALQEALRRHSFKEVCSLFPEATISMIRKIQNEGVHP